MIEPIAQSLTGEIACSLPSLRLRRNRPLSPVGRVKPGKASGLTCCWARSGGSCELMRMTVGVTWPPSWVEPRRAAPPADALPLRTTPLSSLFVAFM
ncbi:hypothetical protein D3C81_1968920 [compost metagenome]